MLSIALWLLGWAAGIGVAGFLSLILLRIVLRAALEVWEYLLMISGVLITHASHALSGFVIEGIRLSVFYTIKSVGAAMAPLSRRWSRAKDSMDAEQAFSDMAKKPNPVREAKLILGLPDEFTAADLKARHLDLIKRIAPDAGGTDWLAARVNDARDVLRKVAS